MATINIDARKVEAVVRNCGNALKDQPYHVVEVMVGLGELMGRTIAAQDMNPIAMKEIAQLAVSHIENTIVAGVHAKGANTGELFDGQ